jgi:hypothetical protein
MIIEDFVMLGKTIPEPNSDGRIFVCSAGLSLELKSLVRLYPLSRYQAPRRWSLNRVPVERNNRDSRFESFRLKGNRNPATHAKINSLFETISEIPRCERDFLIQEFIVRSIREANERRLSLGVIVPKGAIRLHFAESKNSPDSPQLALFSELHETATAGAARFAYQPKLEFCDEDGWHDLQLRDWGAYEFMRKHGDERRFELATAAHLSSGPMLLVGNMNHQRTSWLVISVLFPVAQLDLFSNQENRAA